MPVLVAAVQVVPKPFAVVCLLTRRHVGAVELFVVSQPQSGGDLDHDFASYENLTCFLACYVE